MYLHYDKTNKRWVAIRRGFIISTGTLDECLEKGIEYIEFIRKFDKKVSNLSSA